MPKFKKSFTAKPKEHLLPLLGARNPADAQPPGNDVIFIDHQKFVKRTVNDVTAYFAEGMSAGAARTAVGELSK